MNRQDPRGAEAGRHLSRRRSQRRGRLGLARRVDAAPHRPRDDQERGHGGRLRARAGQPAAREPGRRPQAEHARRRPARQDGPGRARVPQAGALARGKARSPVRRAAADGCQRGRGRRAALRRRQHRGSARARRRPAAELPAHLSARDRLTGRQLALLRRSLRARRAQPRAARRRARARSRRQADLLPLPHGHGRPYANGSRVRRLPCAPTSRTASAATSSRGPTRRTIAYATSRR